MEANLGHLLLQVMRLVGERARAAAGPDSLFPPEFMALKYFKAHPGTSLSTFAEHIRVKKPTATELLKRLMARGFLVRVQSKMDKRVFELEITEEGEKALERGEAAFAAQAGVVFSALDAKEQADLIQLLSKITQNNDA